jgi:hypothetical protein
VPSNERRDEIVAFSSLSLGFLKLIPPTQFPHLTCGFGEKELRL